MIAKLGLEITADGGELAVYSEHATRMFVCLFDAVGDKETERIALTPDGAGVFRASLPGLKPGARYGLRADGPFEPWRGHRFDVEKLLVDPYALELDRAFQLHPKMFEFGADTGGLAPKAIARKKVEGEAGKARISADETIVYELNVRGFSKLNDKIPEDLRGRFAALADPWSIAHLKSLGVTTLELMPCDAFVDERHLPGLKLSNAWGYNSVAFGCPDPRLAPGGWAEVRAAIDALHAAGFEIVLDVVFNHNGESDEFGPTLSFRGLDNALYFRLDPKDQARYINDTGCGNCVALYRAPVVEMAIAALKRWMVLGGVDGFRFDLATSLGRDEKGFATNAPFFKALGDDPVLANGKLIAEPWDLGPGGYRLGQFPPAWGEWNDRFRDTARRFWRGDARTRGELATRIAGSRDLFGAEAPGKSVNYVVSHDGFTLNDLVSYTRKHNEDNGEDNRDGTSENYSWNHGVEGPTDSREINARRRRDMRNLIALNFFARGVPMIAMGSETGHSQRGNNNAYAQNNAVSWIDWRAEKADLARFIGRCAALRSAHPALRPLAWLTGEKLAGADIRDVEWRDADGPLVSGAQWDETPGDAFVAVCAAPVVDGVERVALALNRSSMSRSFTLPAPRQNFAWRVRLDTSDEAVGDAPTQLSDLVELAARSTVIVVEEPVAATRARPATRDEIDALAQAAGIASDWFDVSGKQTIVSAHGKIALLEAMGLPARSEPQARQSLKDLLDATRARRVPASLTLSLDAPRVMPLRSSVGEAARKVDFALALEDGSTIEGHATVGEGRQVLLSDGREILESKLELPELPIGRHRLEIEGVSSALTIAPPQCFSSRAVWRRRFGAAAQIYALRCAAGDQGIGGFSALGLAASALGKHGAAFLGVSPMHALFAVNRDRASPYNPSDRRFLDPLLIDVLADDGLPFDSSLYGEPFERLSAFAEVPYNAVWARKEQVLRARFTTFQLFRAEQPDHPLFDAYTAFVAEGGEALRRFAIFEAISRERRGEDWRRWPEALRESAPGPLAEVEARLAGEVAFAKFCQWLADKQLAEADERAKRAGMQIGLYRDLAIGSAPDGAESWARAAELMKGVSIGAPPDPFSTQGQVWNLPPPNPVAGAQQGWKGLAGLYAANMRHAGLLRIDHAMGLTRLFVVPDGAKPSEGAYVAYPFDELIGQIALESQRHQCAVVGEDLGTVPPGFREKLNQARIYGMKVLWFEREGLSLRDPKQYPVLSIACASTHDLPTLVGWWRGADIGERLSLGLISLANGEHAIANRRAEKREMLAALRRVGALGPDPIELEDEMTVALAAAIHAFIANSGAALASAQLDDLAGEAIATNLPGTDRERPNWRRRHPVDVETLLTRPRAAEILAAMAKGRM